MERPRIDNYSDPGPEFNIKAQELSALKDALLEVAAGWHEEYVYQMIDAMTLAEKLHADDRHKNMPYIYHLTRAAVRIAVYLDLNDPDVIIAALLHDSVEDHAAELVVAANADDAEKIDTLPEREVQQMALGVLGGRFSERAARIISAVTNVPDEDQPTGYIDKLTAYANKVHTAVQTPEGWVVKLVDWCDNGVGVIHDIEGQGHKHQHFRRKYGKVLPILEARFLDDDIQAMLSPAAKAYVRRQFERGRQRLIVPDEY